MKKKTLKWILVAGARPNFMKIAPLIRAIKLFNQTNQTNYRNQKNQINQTNQIDYLLIHTGQHYDYEMSQVFFQDLELPRPDIYLGVGSGTHAEQTGKVMIEFEKVLFKEKPDLIIVVGDVNSTLACALTTSKIDYSRDFKLKSQFDGVNSKQLLVSNQTNLINSINPMNIKGNRPLIAHVEAGLRSFDRTMPEEINRLLTDQVSDYLFTPSPDADENLLKEGIPKKKIFLVGDIMVDSLLFNLEKAQKSPILYKLGLTKFNPTNQIDEIDQINPTNQTNKTNKTNPTDEITPYALLTLHRPGNVDDRDAFLRIIQALTEISKHIPIIFPIHPRTRQRLADFGLANPQSAIRNLKYIDPLGYLDFLNLMMHSKFVMTDSGGIQEETTALGIPCLTLRDTTERPITITEGTNVLVHNNPKRIIEEVNKIMNGKQKKSSCPSIWDGHTAERIVNILAERRF